MKHFNELLAGKHFAQGLTLVELLVSLSLGLLLSAGMVSAYLVAKRNHHYQEELARIQENGRYAMRVLSRELAMAGFHGGLPLPTDFPSESVGVDCSEEDWALDRAVLLDLVDDHTGPSPPLSVHDTEFTCFEPSAIAPDTDLIAVKRTAAEASLLRGVPASTLTASAVESWFLRLVHGLAPQWEHIAPRDLRDASRALPSLNYWEAIARVFFIRTYSTERGDDIPSLCMETLAGNELTARCLVEGVENMQFEFGVDTDDDGVPNRYMSALTPDDLRRAVTARVYLLLRSIGPISGYRNDKTYRLGQKVLPVTDDAYLRRVMSSTVVLRNHTDPVG